MNNLKHIFFASMLMANITAAAQETYQDAKLAAPQLTGTARYVGMGGAMEALGADISTISSNPAGVGLFRKSQVSLSAGVIAQSGAENYVDLGQTPVPFNGKKSHPTFEQVGIVWSPKVKGNNWMNLAFNYHKSSDFGQILTAVGALNNVSLNKITALKNSKKYAGWTIQDCNLGGYNEGKNYMSGLLIVPSDGGLAYAEANQFGFGQYQHGYIGTYDFNISCSLRNQVWLGLTIGIHDVHYNSNSFYGENFVDGNMMDSYEQLKITGTGFDVKGGIIFRPVKNSPFRIGAYFNSPVFYDLTLCADNDISIYGNSENPATYEEKDGTRSLCYVKENRGKSVVPDYDFRLNTPWKIGFSMGHTVGNFLALGATYEYAWYNHIDNRVKDGGYYDYYLGNYYESSSSDEAMNHDTRLNLQGASTLKLGAEIKPMDLLSIRLGYNYVSPMFKNNAYRDQTFDSYGVYAATSADYTNWKATNRITCGLGFNYENLTIDVAYQYSTQKGDFYPFESFDEDGCSVNATKVDNKRHQLLMTVGYKF